MGCTCVCDRAAGRYTKVVSYLRVSFQVPPITRRRALTTYPTTSRTRLGLAGPLHLCMCGPAVRTVIPATYCLLHQLCYVNQIRDAFIVTSIHLLLDFDMCNSGFAEPPLGCSCRLDYIHRDSHAAKSWFGKHCQIHRDHSSPTPFLSHQYRLSSLLVTM